ncbi:MAG TPA: circularly permuted type 2 ATP-grasp protein, partial [Sporolactobacillaceae bacterium]|nr:circularly permuted type 2 ATP-grasp protein [Sporolactobacillaceae bacterium]
MAAIVLETGTTTPVWAAYKSGEGMFDEMLDLANCGRSGCQPTAKALFSMPPDWFAEISGRAQQMFRRMGVTFNVYGGADGVERIFPFDPIPRVIDADTWATLEAGLIQRVRALNMFVADVYGEGSILADGIVPRDLVLGCPQFRRAAVGIKPPLGNFITVAGIDLVRGADGRFYVLEDNARTP